MGIGLDLNGLARTRRDSEPAALCRELCDWLEANAEETFEGMQTPPLEGDDDEDDDHDHDHDGDSCGLEGEDCGHDHDYDHDHDHDHDDEECAQTVGSVSFFPSSEPLYVECGPEGRLRFGARTSGLGPGYHRWLCNLLRDLGREFDVDWSDVNEDGEPADETGYFFGGDPVRVDQEMRTWLKAVCSMLGDYLNEGLSRLSLSMSPDRLYLDFGPVNTILGPRSTEWIARTAANPASGTDVFPWWEDGLGAAFHRNRALCRMWEEALWRPPCDDDELGVLQSIHNDLSEAYRLDPTLPLPWQEWDELLTHAESSAAEELGIAVALRATIRELAASQPAADKIGYRRGNVRINLAGGWSVTVPGSMQETQDDEGNWGVVDDDRQVWISSINLRRKNGEVVPAAELLDSVLEEGPGDVPFRDDQEILGSGAFVWEDDAETPHWQFSGRCAVAGSIALTTILFVADSERDWALDVWRSIQHQDDE